MHLGVQEGRVSPRSQWSQALSLVAPTACSHRDIPREEAEALPLCSSRQFPEALHNPHQPAAGK